jgi:hypothetical protein
VRPLTPRQNGRRLAKHSGHGAYVYPWKGCSSGRGSTIACTGESGLDTPMPVRYCCYLVLLAPMVCRPAPSPGAAGLTADEIVQESVKAMDRDWKAAPNYAFTESDTIVKGGETTRKTYRVLMIDGSTYNRLIAVNGEPLSAAQSREEDRKLQQEIARRRSESPDARRKRIEKYTQGRRQDHELMKQMAKGFQYRLLGSESLNGHTCYVIEATPKPGYVPPSRDTKVLTGMRGKLWIDEHEYQWVKVHAEVFRPVAFGLFIAKVQPGTEFTLENKPVAKDIWLPSRFSTRVRATILGFWSRNSLDEETYTDYQPMSDIQLNAGLSRE